ncbi:MAG: 3-methyl-2-oxobutanoate dehydrogenase subunit VorB [Synergistales bacterium]|nr:3-methyl-2-oxobutanoate dehydrogenase subunit VorB [Synergistales bacterium]
MSDRVLMKGNEALAEAAVQAGCRHFFGYPITPQNELPEYMSRRLPEVGGVYLQAESEVAAINMLMGAGATGERIMTSSSSPGISLMSEGISYIAGAEVPCVLINMVRGGPGLGGILPGQADYLQATKGGGHGDYHLLVLAPSTLQEGLDLTMLAFDLAEKYRNPVMVLADGFMGQMMEAVEFRKPEPMDLPDKREWAIGYMKERGGRSLVESVHLDPDELDEHNEKLQAKYRRMRDEEIRVETYRLDDAELVVAAFGTTARIARSSVDTLREQGVKVGLVRPITVYPFPYETFETLPESVKAILTVEMNCGQMIEDVKLGVGHDIPVSFFGHSGGHPPQVEEITEKLTELARERGCA